MKRFLTLLLALMTLTAAAASGAESAGSPPRGETLWIGGLQWGPVASWNPLGMNQNNALALAASPSGSRTLMFETAYMYNPLNGSLYPLLAEGRYEWDEGRTALRFRVNPDARWSDGTPVTADDFAATWDAGALLRNDLARTYGSCIAAVENDGGAVAVRAVLSEDGKPVNPLLMLNYLTGAYVCQKAWIDRVIARCGGDPEAILAEDGKDAPYSGPYGYGWESDQLVVLVRNDAYWGQAASLWGRLPTPRYIAHALYADSAGTQEAFMDGRIDVNRRFVANIQDLHTGEKLPVYAYADKAPYGFCTAMADFCFNAESEALRSPGVRRAIAMATDCEAILANAMTGQSPSFAEVPRSLFSPVGREQALYDRDAAADLRWDNADTEGAKALLNGEKLSLIACCPAGEAYAQVAVVFLTLACRQLGIELSVRELDREAYRDLLAGASPEPWDIVFRITPGAEPAAPWSRVRALMGSGVNPGRYRNERAEEILAAIPVTEDAQALRDLYTEANRIYLTEVPGFSVAYCPETFHYVSERVWTGFPREGDGTNIPPLGCTDGYGIAALYQLKRK